MTNKRANLIAGGLFGYAFAAFAIFFVVVMTWTRAAPSVPNVASGQIYRHNEHGSTTYFTAFQATSCALLFFSAFLSFLLCMAIGPKKNMRVTRLGGVPLGCGWDHDDPDNAGKRGALWGAASTLAIVLVLGPPVVAWLNSMGVVFPF
jgi:hypothetical protein